MSLEVHTLRHLFVHHTNIYQLSPYEAVNGTTGVKEIQETFAKRAKSLPDMAPGMGWLPTIHGKILSKKIGAIRACLKKLQKNEKNYVSEKISRNI